VKKILFLSGIDFKDKSIKVISETPIHYAKKGWCVNYIVCRDACRTGNYFYEDEINPENIKVKRMYWPFPNIRCSSNRFLRLAISKVSSLIVISKLTISGASYLFRNKDCAFVYGYEMQGVLASNLLKIIFFKRSVFYISRFQGVFYIKEHFKDHRYLNLLFNIDTLIALWLPSNLMVMTNDGTQGDKILKKIKSRSLKSFMFISNGVDSPNLIDKNKLCKKYGIDEEKPFVLMASRLVNIKRVHLAVEAIGKIISDGNNFNYKLIIIGDGPELEPLKSLAIDLGVDSYLIFLGALTNDEVYSFMSASDMVLSLYESSNIGNPFFEAMSVGTPFIAVNNGDTSSFVKHLSNGYLLSEDAIVDDLVIFFENVENNLISIKSLADGASKYSKSNILSWSERIGNEISEIETLMKRKTII
jgi:glycosyltransferase involved in cell wall biosynthesis